MKKADCNKKECQNKSKKKKIAIGAALAGAAALIGIGTIIKKSKDKNKQA